MLVSSDHVPGGILYVPYPRISVTGFTIISSLVMNSTGTPSASATQSPITAPRILFFFSIKTSSWKLFVIDECYLNIFFKSENISNDVLV